MITEHTLSDLGLLCADWRVAKHTDLSLRFVKASVAGELSLILERPQCPRHRKKLRLGNALAKQLLGAVPVEFCRAP